MTDTAHTSASTATVQAYLRFWNSEPGDAQRRAGEDMFRPDITYIAPVGVLAGVAALVDFTRQFREHVGAYSFDARSEPDVHHDRVRLPWQLKVGDAVFAEGTDVLITDESGRITTVSTFLDRAPEGFDPHTDH